MTLAEQWIIIQHARFDFSVESEPYHASQVLVNQESKEFIVRVWGKTFRFGFHKFILLLMYRAGLSIGRKVFKVMFLGVPPSCLGSR